MNFQLVANYGDQTYFEFSHEVRDIFTSFFQQNIYLATCDKMSLLNVLEYLCFTYDCKITCHKNHTPNSLQYTNCNASCLLITYASKLFVAS